ncbi:MAG: hypothetical protein HY075_08885 [Deltaproteobacteria bacterium]|nr:hypothetical protein [Deltaproteobacteria bacterium]
MAEANNEFYRQARDLGANAKMSELMILQDKIMGPAMRSLNQEHLERSKAWKGSIKANALTKEEFLEIFGYELGAKGDGKGEDGKDGAKKDGEAGKPTAAGRVGALQNTGEQGGSDGAKDAKFGGKRESANKIKVNADGIIE